MNGTLFAIQITGYDLKIVRIHRENGSAIASSMEHIRFSEDAEEKGPSPLPDRLRAIRMESGEEHPQALLILNSEELDYQDFSYPFDTDRKVRNAIEYELSTDYPEEEYIRDYVKALGRDPGYHTYLAALAPRPGLRDRVRAVEEAGFRILGITADVSTLGIAFRHEEEALVMDTGEHHTLFALYRLGVPVLLRKIPIGVQAVTKASGNGAQGADVQLISEIKRTIHSFGTKTGFDLKRLHVTGNLLLFRECFETFQKRIPIETVFKPARDQDIVVEDAGSATADVHVFASLIGAAVWKRKGGAFHFHKDEFVSRDSALFMPHLLRWASGCVVAFLLLLLLSYGLDLMALRERRDFLQAEMRKTFTEAFPQVTRIVDERKQAKNLLDMETSAVTGGSPHGSASLLAAFRGISATIPMDVPFQIMSLFWETGKIEMYGRTDAFKTVNAIQEFLSGYEGFSQVTISNARHSEEGQDVEFKLSIRLAG